MSTATAELTTGRDQWKQRRMSGLGASEWLTVLGMNPQKSAFELACEKLGEIEPENLDDQEDVIFGRLLEPVALNELARRTGRIVTHWPQDQVVVSPSHDFLFATPDGLQEDKELGHGVAETKNRNEWMAREWKESAPLAVQVQVNAQMFCTGRMWGTICVILGGNRFRHFDVQRDDSFIAAALPLLEAFWTALRAGQKPDIVPTASVTRAIKKLHPLDNGNEIELPETFDGVYDELTAISARLKALETRKEYLQNGVRLAIGDNTFGTLPTGRSFSWKTQNRSQCCPNCQTIISESTYRVLRQAKAPKGKAVFLLDAERKAIVAQVTAALLAHGAMLRFESPSGSRYFVLAGELELRVSDHEPNEKTDNWMGRKQVASIRVDQPEWREQLELITGPLQIEG